MKVKGSGLRLRGTYFGGIAPPAAYALLPSSLHHSQWSIVRRPPRPIYSIKKVTIHFVSAPLSSGPLCRTSVRRCCNLIRCTGGHTNLGDSRGRSWNAHVRIFRGPNRGLMTSHILQGGRQVLQATLATLTWLQLRERRCILLQLTPAVRLPVLIIGYYMLQVLSYFPHYMHLE